MNAPSDNRDSQKDPDVEGSQKERLSVPESTGVAAQSESGPHALNFLQQNNFYAPGFNAKEIADLRNDAPEYYEAMVHVMRDSWEFTKESSRKEQDFMHGAFSRGQWVTVGIAAVAIAAGSTLGLTNHATEAVAAFSFPALAGLANVMRAFSRRPEINDSANSEEP